MASFASSDTTCGARKHAWTKTKDVLESQMTGESDTLKIMTMGRGYLLGLLRFIWTFFKNVSTLDQNYHILKVDSIQTKVVFKK